jgi:hypothetical protein
MVCSVAMKSKSDGHLLQPSVSFCISAIMESRGAEGRLVIKILDIEKVTAIIVMRGRQRKRGEKTML